MEAHDSLHDSQPKAGTGLLGGHKRLKSPSRHFGGDARPVVDHGNFPTAIAEPSTGDSDPRLRAVGDRFDRVRDQVVDDLLEAVWLGDEHTGRFDVFYELDSL